MSIKGVTTQFESERAETTKEAQKEKALVDLATRFHNFLSQIDTSGNKIIDAPELSVKYAELGIADNDESIKYLETHPFVIPTIEQMTSALKSCDLAGDRDGKISDQESKGFFSPFSIDQIPELPKPAKARE